MRSSVCEVCSTWVSISFLVSGDVCLVLAPWTKFTVTCAKRDFFWLGWVEPCALSLLQSKSLLESLEGRWWKPHREGGRYSIHGGRGLSFLRITPLWSVVEAGLTSRCHEILRYQTVPLFKPASPYDHRWMVFLRIESETSEALLRSLPLPRILTSWVPRLYESGASSA